MVHTQGNVEGFEWCHISHKNSVSSSYEIPDGRNCVLCLRYLSYSLRRSTKTEQREVRRLDNLLLHEEERSEQESSAWSFRRPESIPPSRRFPEEGEEE